MQDLKTLVEGIIKVPRKESKSAGIYRVFFGGSWALLSIMIILYMSDLLVQSVLYYVPADICRSWVAELDGGLEFFRLQAVAVVSRKGETDRPESQLKSGSMILRTWSKPRSVNVAHTISGISLSLQQVVLMSLDG